MNSKKALAESISKNMYDLHMTQAKYAKEIGIQLTTLDKIAYGTGIDPWELIKP